MKVKLLRGFKIKKNRQIAQKMFFADGFAEVSFSLLIPYVTTTFEVFSYILHTRILLIKNCLQSNYDIGSS